MSRTTSCVRVGIGLASALAPGRLLRATAAPDTSLDRGVARLLGARYILQGAVALLAHTPPRLDAAVDLAHAISMVPVALLARHERRAALASGAVALMLATTDLVADRRQR